MRRAGVVEGGKRMRSGLDSRAPCSICSVRSPKFDDGFLVLCSDGQGRHLAELLRVQPPPRPRQLDRGGAVALHS